VWCTNKSGGIERDWVGVPRRYFKPGNELFLLMPKHYWTRPLRMGMSQISRRSFYLGSPQVLGLPKTIIE